MAILTTQSASSVPAEPKIWIQRISLFRSLEPVDEIRSIRFQSGVNIIWGEEEEATKDKPFEPGHGVGKTTLCRLIRYCLGEATFGQSETVAEIRNTFPKGYVAAEVRFNGTSWSVARPIGRQRPHYAAKGISIQELVSTKPEQTTFEQYVDELRACALSNIRSQGILSDGTSLHWEHILSMCSRDQEARYQSFWDWRSERSDSKLKSHDLPKKVDAFLCIRTILGLLSEAEVSQRASLRDKTTELKSVEKDIDEKRREPEFLIKHQRKTLVERFGCDDAMTATMDASEMFSLPKIVERRSKALQDEVNTLRPRIEELNAQIRVALARIQEPKEMLAAPLAEIARLEHSTRLLTGITAEEERYRREMDEVRELPCSYGKVSFGQCRHIQDELTRIEVKNEEFSRKNAKDIVQNEDDLAALKAETKGTQFLVKSNLDALKDLEKDRNDLIAKQSRLLTDLEELSKAFSEITKQESVRQGQMESTELGALTVRRTALDQDVLDIRGKLAEIEGSFAEATGTLRQLFEDVVKVVLSKDFIGTVKTSLDEIVFSIKRRRSLSGEAFQTLKILLADISLLLTGATGTSNHPCLLIHDSPREADLGIAIYRHFITTMLLLSNELQTGKQSPFQYIVTTTTPPPDDLKAGAYKLGGKHGTLLVDPLVAESDEKSRSLFDDEKGDE